MMNRQTQHVRRPLRVVVTTNCNAKCVHCHHEGVAAPMGYLDADRFREQVEPEFFQGFGKVSITGGEPLTHPRIGSIVAHVVSSTDAIVAVNTNGLTHSRRLAELLRLGVREVHVSVHSSHPAVNARVFGIPHYDQARAFRTAEAIVANGADLFVNRVILPGVNAAPAEVVDFAEQWTGERSARVQLFPNLFENAAATEQIFTNILTEARRRGYRCLYRGREHVFDHASRGSFTWVYPCTPEALDPPDYAAAAIFLTPRMGLKRMLSPREWAWRDEFNHKLPASLGCRPPDGAEPSWKPNRAAKAEIEL